jgi:hypothetical protein
MAEGFAAVSQPSAQKHINLNVPTTTRRIVLKVEEIWSMIPDITHAM